MSLTTRLCKRSGPLAVFTAMIMVAGGATGAAAAADSGSADVEDIIQAVTGAEPTALVGEAAVGRVLEIAPASEVDDTYVAHGDDGSTSVVAAIEDGWHH